MNALNRSMTAALLASVLHATSSPAADPPAPPGAEAAALEDKAAAMESDIDKACQKVAPQARPLCREQYAQAVQRVRAQAARKR